MPNGLLWPLSGPSFFTLLKASSRRYKIFLPPGRACLSCSQEEEQFRCYGEKGIKKNKWKNTDVKQDFRVQLSQTRFTPSHAIPHYSAGDVLTPCKLQVDLPWSPAVVRPPRAVLSSSPREQPSAISSARGCQCGHWDGLGDHLL